MKKINHEFGERGHHQLQFYCPYGIVCDITNKHRILVADYANHRIQVFSRDGQYLNQFGSKGTQQGQFQHPSQLSIQPITNRIIVADYSNNRLQILDSQGQFMTMLGQDMLEDPCAVECSRYYHNNQQQHIVTADSNRRIHLFSSSSSNNNNNNNEYQLLRSFCSTGSNPNQTKGVFGICFDDERKRILIADCNNQRMSVWSNDGSQFLHTIPMPYNNHFPISVCVDYYGHYPHHIVVGTYQSQIHIYDARMEQQQQQQRGSVLQTIGSQGKQPGQFYSGICGVCMDDDGALLTTDWGNHRVQIFGNHRSSSMISLLASTSSYHYQHPFTIPQSRSQQQYLLSIPSVYTSFVNDRLFDRHLIGEIAQFLPIYYL